jgi:hypothetical protein
MWGGVKKSNAPIELKFGVLAGAIPSQREGAGRGLGNMHYA